MDYLDFVVFHVGGKGGIGKPSRIFKLCKKRPNVAKLYVFEADLSDKSDVEENKAYIEKMKRKYHCDAKILQYCVSDHNGVENFYINRDRWSSSLFKMAPEMETYNWPPMEEPMWKEHCITDEVREIKVTTFDEICKNDLDVSPDFLSMDAQGSEKAIMDGAKTLFDKDILGVATETEFREIYDKQPLFSDQDSFLREHGFIFANFIDTQEWFPGPPVGRPFFTVGEVIYLKDYMYMVKKYKEDLDILIPLIIKLASISEILGFPSYSYLVMDYMFKNYNKECSLFVDNSVDEVVLDMKRLYRKGGKK
jgi:FkbM family methyltransferase